MQAGANLAEAQRKHSEAFLRYKAMDPHRTDGVARAMADIDVDLKGAEVDWAITQTLIQDSRQEFQLQYMELMMEGNDANQSASQDDTERQGHPRSSNN